MWEIFALFGLRAVLIYYLVKQLQMPQDAAVRVYALSTAACILMGVIGGFLADRYLGVRRAVALGGLLMAAGSFALIDPQMLYVGLALTAIGNGLFKPTLAAQVGMLYADDDPRRQRAYTAYKVGCNLGAIGAPLICGAIGAAFGWNWSFLASGIGMVMSVIVFRAGWHLLPDGRRPARSIGGDARSDRRQTILVALAVWLGAVLFWVAYRQIESTVVLWADQDLDRMLQVAGRRFEIPAAWFQSVNPFLLFLFAPLVNWIWSRRSGKVQIASDVGRMAVGCMLLALCFGVLALASYGHCSESRVSFLWLVLAIAPLTFAELYVDPIGQGLFSRLAPARFTALFVSVWFLASFTAYLVCTQVGRIWVQVEPAPFFAGVAAVALTGAAVMAIGRRVAADV
jgi:POT family proton-dependent oligopeptide transporter